MPKLSRRKRQLKEIYYRRQDEEDGSGNDEPEEQKPSSARSAAGGTNSSSSKPRKNNSTQSLAKEDDKVWVQCNTCDKWRALPHDVDPNSLPDIWVCSLNTYDSTRNNCDAPEENFKDHEEDEQLQAFFKLWLKKLKNADRAENCLPSSAVTRGRKRKLDTEWIQCSSPSCGKWRAVSRGIETSTLLRRMNKGRHFGGEGVWYCSMNTWDDTTASCAAPQEPLWNCRWNLSNIQS